MSMKMRNCMEASGEISSNYDMCLMSLSQALMYMHEVVGTMKSALSSTHKTVCMIAVDFDNQVMNTIGLEKKLEEIERKVGIERKGDECCEGSEGPSEPENPRNASPKSGQQLSSAWSTSVCPIPLPFLLLDSSAAHLNAWPAAPCPSLEPAAQQHANTQHAPEAPEHPHTDTRGTIDGPVQESLAIIPSKTGAADNCHAPPTVYLHSKARAVSEHPTPEPSIHLLTKARTVSQFPIPEPSTHLHTKPRAMSDHRIPKSSAHLQTNVRDATKNPIQEPPTFFLTTARPTFVCSLPASPAHRRTRASQHRHSPTLLHTFPRISSESTPRRLPSNTRISSGSTARLLHADARVSSESTAKHLPSNGRISSESSPRIHHVDARVSSESTPRLLPSNARISSDSAPRPLHANARITSDPAPRHLLSNGALRSQVHLHPAGRPSSACYTSPTPLPSYDPNARPASASPAPSPPGSPSLDERPPPVRPIFFTRPVSQNTSPPTPVCPSCRFHPPVTDFYYSSVPGPPRSSQTPSGPENDAQWPGGPTTPSFCYRGFDNPSHYSDARSPRLEQWFTNSDFESPLHDPHSFSSSSAPGMFQNNHSARVADTSIDNAGENKTSQFIRLSFQRSLAKSSGSAGYMSGEGDEWQLWYAPNGAPQESQTESAVGGASRRAKTQPTRRQTMGSRLGSVQTTRPSSAKRAFTAAKRTANSRVNRTWSEERATRQLGAPGKSTRSARRPQPLKPHSAPAPASASAPKPSSEERARMGRKLVKAAHDGDAAETRRLLDAGADPNHTSGSKWTPLHRAVWRGFARVASLLLSRGADVHARTACGYTALHVAAYNDPSGDCLRALLAAGADPNARTNARWTPLHFAAQYGNTVALCILLAAGASPFARNREAKTALDLAKNAAVRRLMM